MNRDIHNNIDVVEVLGAATQDDDVTSSAIDMQGYEAAELVLSIGAGGITFNGTNKIEFKLTHSDDDSTYSAVDADDIDGLSSVGTGGIIKSLTSAHASSAVYHYGYIGGKRYLKLQADFGGTHGTGTPMAAVLIKGLPHQS